MPNFLFKSSCTPQGLMHSNLLLWLQQNCAIARNPFLLPHAMMLCCWGPAGTRIHPQLFCRVFSQCAWICPGWVAASHSAPNQPPQLQLARPGASRDAAQWQWHAIEVTKLATLEPEVTKAIEALSFKTLQVGRE